MIRFIEKHKGVTHAELRRIVDAVATKGATPLVVAEGPQVAGWWCLKTSSRRYQGTAGAAAQGRRADGDDHWR